AQLLQFKISQFARRRLHLSNRPGRQLGRRGDGMNARFGSSGGVALATMARLGSLILGLAFQIVVAKALAAGEYAAYSVAFAIAAVVGTLSNFGIARSLSRFLPLVIAYGTGSDLIRALAFNVLIKASGLGMI